MATKKKEITRSEQIREYLRKHRSPKSRLPRAVQEGLAENGIDVSTELISQVKLTMKRKRRKGGKKTRTASEYEYQFTTDHLIAAKKFSDELAGDFDAAKAALDVVAKLQ